MMDTIAVSGSLAPHNLFLSIRDLVILHPWSKNAASLPIGEARGGEKEEKERGVYVS
jgi:hypothetical protein